MISKFIYFIFYFIFSSLLYSQFSELRISTSTNHLSELVLSKNTSVFIKIGKNSGLLTKIFLTAFIAIICLTGAILFNWLKRSRFTNRKYEEFIRNIYFEKEQAQNLIEIQKISESKTINNITEYTIQSIIIKLDKFEKSEKYLRKDINIAWLANHLNTNTKYLSEVIKKQKNKNFPSYINGLRIDYVVQKLIEDPIYRDYKIVYLAEECGYSSRQVFINSFKKETGFAPSYFIDNLEKKTVENNALT